jgi:hypothetical protein
MPAPIFTNEFLKNHPTDEILKNFAESATKAKDGHEKRWIIWSLIVVPLILAGLAAMFYAHPILATLLLLSAVFCSQRANTHHVLSEMSNQHLPMAYLIASVANKTEAGRTRAANEGEGLKQK